MRGRQRREPTVLVGAQSLSWPEVCSSVKGEVVGDGPVLTDCSDSFAYAQMSLELTKLLWTFDMEIVDPKLDFERDSQMLFQWRKPRMNVRFWERV